MAMSIRSRRVEDLSRQLAHVRGTSMTEAIQFALEQSLSRQGGSALDRLTAISGRCAALPTLDDRSPDEILGYDSHGVPSGGN